MKPEVLAFQLFTHATLTHNFFQSAVLALNGPFWSLALEAQLYLIFPLIIFGYKRFGITKTLICIFAVQMAFRLPIAWMYGTDYTDATFVLPWSVAGRMFEFAIGTLAAFLIGRSHSAKTIRLWSRGGPILALVCCCLGLFAKQRLGVTAPLTDLFWSFGFWCLLLAASIPGTILNKILSFRPIVGLGIISYSVYLVHEIFLPHFTSYITQISSQPAFILAMSIPCLSLTILCCYIFYRIVERPSQNFFSRRRIQSQQTNIKKPMLEDLSTTIHPVKL